MKNIGLWITGAALFSLAVTGCGKSDTPGPIVPENNKILINTVSLNGNQIAAGGNMQNVAATPLPEITITLQRELDPQYFTANTVTISPTLGFTYAFEDTQTIKLELTSTPASNTTYTINIPQGTNSAGGKVVISYTGKFTTAIDESDKFPRISDDELLTKVQRVTFKYFWDYGHATSGLAREGSTHGDHIITTGGSGFGIAAIPVAVEREFITRADAVARMNKIANFLWDTAETFHGAYPHWMNGGTGKVIPFGSTDNGADLVETAFLMQGLIIAREYFDGTGDEATLRTTINKILDRVEWDWFRKSGENVLYWHWSPDQAWVLNMKVQGWNECLMTYVLAAASTTHTITKDVYTKGWGAGSTMKTPRTHYGITMPIGPSYGGPLFWAHYSFIGLDPRKLQDTYANYWDQNVAHSKINHAYCVANPKGFAGYSAECWGLTASNVPSADGNYNASSPTSDKGTIAPTAALSSMPYTPVESMAALRYFYYKRGDKLWNENKYGFYDAFSPMRNWVSNEYLAIDQGPIICMIENHRTGLLWELFMQAPEVQAGLTKLGISWQ